MRASAYLIASQVKLQWSVGVSPTDLGGHVIIFIFVLQHLAECLDQNELVFSQCLLNR